MSAALLNGRPPAQAMTLATPFNDIQLVALIAGQQPTEPRKAVAFAMEIVAEAIAQAPAMSGLIRLKQQELAKAG